jgi:hypothetical protein
MWGGGREGIADHDIVRHLLKVRGGVVRLGDIALVFCAALLGNIHIVGVIEKGVDFALKVFSLLSLLLGLLL